MSQQSEYNEINRILANLAVRRRVPRILDYINDLEEIESDDPILKTYPELQGVSGGEKWAHMFFQSMTTERMVDVVHSKLNISPQTVRRFLRIGYLSYH